jgi:hypothetical protein
MKDITDGTSNTLMMGEGLGRDTITNDRGWSWVGVGVMWTKRGIGIPGVPGGSDLPGISAISFGSYHPGICQFSWADGSVRSLRPGETYMRIARLTPDFRFFQALAGVADGVVTSGNALE